MPDDAFNPAAEAEFRVGMPDHINAIGASLVRTARHDAPGLRISIQNVWGRQAIEALKADKIDLAYTGALLGLSSPEIETELLGTETYVVIVRAGHPLLERPFDLDAYVEAEHVVEGFGGEVHGEVHGIVDAALGKLGRARRIGAQLPLFSWVMQTVASSDMIATVGRGWANMEARTRRSSSRHLVCSPPGTDASPGAPCVGGYSSACSVYLRTGPPGRTRLARGTTREGIVRVRGRSRRRNRLRRRRNRLRRRRCDAC